MTNEEIEKRFLFDLKLGCFKKSNEAEIISFKDQNGNEYNYHRMMTLLKNNGFKRTHNSKYLSNIHPRSFPVLFIFPDLNVYRLNDIKDIDINYRKFNDMPDYINEYITK